jgi:hypothetical protein
VKSSIELGQIMNSPGSIDDFSYIGMNYLLFPWQNGDGYAFFSSTIFAANACFLIKKCRFCIDFDGF